VLEKKYLQSVDAFIFNSKTTQRVVKELLMNGKPSLVAYPPTDRFGNPISEEEITERASNQELRLVFVGNVIHRKGLHILLEALKLMGREDSSSYKLDIIGGLTSEPRYASEMERYVRRHGLSSIVKFHGTLDNHLLIEMYKHAQVMVVPSSYEGFGIVYLEGMCFGLPAIGTTAGAASEIITHGQDGYLIEPDDARALVNHLHELAGNRELLVRLSLNAVKRYLSQPKWVETAKNIREFMYQLVTADASTALRAKG
jgi:glycosyltransferase involved in cell wall biosynthesis